MSETLNWRLAYGPIGLAMPKDPVHQPGFDWGAAYFMGRAQQREDSLDRLNTDRTWGSLNPAEQGGSGFVFGHSTDDLDSCIVAAKAMENTNPKPDEEHAIRWFRHSMEWWELSRDPAAARAFVRIASNMIATGYQLAPYVEHVMASPHTGVSMNGRIFGWKSYARAEQMRIAPTSRAWARMFVDVCEQAAMPKTGQVLADVNTGGGALDQENVVYCYHQGILLFGMLACCAQLGKPVPTFVFDWMGQIENLPLSDYYGTPSMPAFLYTKGERLKPCTGPGQHPDPFFGLWSTLCVVLAKMTGERDRWLRKATKIGPTTNNTEDERKLTMLFRGATQ